MLELNITNWLLAFLPLFLLLVTMVGFKWSAPKAGILAWVVAGFCGWLFFGADGFLGLWKRAKLKSFCIAGHLVSRLSVQSH